MFALDIQICGPNLILVRDGAYSVQLNSLLTELSPIPRLKVKICFEMNDSAIEILVLRNSCADTRMIEV